ncbi:MAG: hypothetical protein HXY39_12195 [Chloroflexi bacterium]|nr:hypothetical protein [Chloroflexota bacterium]
MAQATVEAWPGRVARLLRREHPASRDHVGAEVVELSDASVGTVEASKVTLSRTLVRSVSAGDDVMMTLSGALSVQATGDVTMTGGVAPLVFAGRDLRMRSATAVIAAAPEVRVESGTVGVLLARSAELGDRARVILTARDALLLGGALGILVPLIAYLLRRFAPPPAEAEPQPWYRRLGFWFLRRLLVLGSTGLLGWLVYRSVRGQIARRFSRLPGL